MKESKIQKDILNYLNGIEGCKAINNHTGAFDRSGEPDIFGCYNGIFLAFEVKRANDEKPTPIQAKRLNEWLEVGAVTGVVSSVEDVQQKLLHYSYKFFEKGG